MAGRGLTRSMIEILAGSLIPVFAGLLVGYIAGIREVVDNKDLRTLITFVMSFAVPCALFTTIVRAPHSLLLGEGNVVLVLAVTYLVTYAFTYFAARRLGKLSGADSAVLSLTLSFPNAAAIGIPLLPAVYGSTASINDVVAIAVGAVTYRLKLDLVWQIAVAVAIWAVLAWGRPAIQLCMWTAPIIFLSASPTESIASVGFYRGCEVILGILIGGLFLIAADRSFARAHPIRRPRRTKS